MPILLVEDHAELGSLIVEGLKRSGISTDPVGNAGDADRALATTRYAAVVLDLGLPDEDGLSWLRGVRGRGDSTPVLALTARDGISDCGATVQVIRCAAWATCWPRPRPAEQAGFPLP